VTPPVGAGVAGGARPAIWWIRRDLRAGDNAALAAASAAGPVVALFVLDPVLWARAGAPRRRFLAGCLAALDAELDGRLVVRSGDPARVVAAVVAEVSACLVACEEDFAPYGRRRDARVAASLEALGVPLVLAGSPYASLPGRLRTGAGRPFSVFTPFRRAWEAAGWAPPAPVPRVAFLGLDGEDLPVADEPGAPGEPAVGGEPLRPGGARLTGERGVPGAPVAAAELPVPGARGAHDRLERFLREGLPGYATNRNNPGVEGTSRLSPYLRFGCIHPRQVLAAVTAAGAEGGPAAPSERDVATFVSELAWREFYADVLFHRPDSVRVALQPAMAGLELDRGELADARFAAWVAGRTGYPIVDAGMRQLLAEGWMHNRVRMIVASFLVKDLHLDWRDGARHFLDSLVDGDLASNTHGWQWTAGTGTDAAPYYRVFNPTLQGERFDPDGAYVARYVPELAAVARDAGGGVHRPERLAGGWPGGYPRPIVEHDAERAEALRRWEALRR
jgi:deoxyribodipyrimidine photo-lyase